MTADNKNYRLCFELVNGKIETGDYGPLEVSPEEALQTISDEWDRMNAITVGDVIYSGRHIIKIWLEEEPEKS